MSLPVFEMMINPDENSEVEVMAVALVDKPAIERNFMTFSSQVLHFKADPEKKIISGPAMVADTLIYRKDQNGEYNVFFSADTIRAIALKFSKKGYGKNLNLFHDPELPADGVAIFNSFVSDKSMGIMPMKGFEDLPDGSWFISAKVENDEIWAKIKNGDVKGFSVEGNFSLVRNGTNEPDGHLSEKGLMADLKKWFKDQLDEMKKTLFDTNTPPATPTTPAAPVVPAAQSAVKTKDGVEVSIDKMEVGGVAMVGDAPAAAGELELEDGTKVTIGEGGVITAITPAAAPEMDYTKQFSAIEERFTAYEQKFQQQAEAFEKLNQGLANANATIVKLVTIVEKMAEMPTSEPSAPNTTNFSKAEGKEAKIKTLAEQIKKLKTA